MGGVASGTAYLGYGKAGAFVAELAGDGVFAVADSVLQQRLQQFGQLLRRDPVEFSNLERFLWTPGEDGRNRALQFYQRMFDVCVRSKSLETKQAFVQLILWLAEHNKRNADSPQAMIQAGLVDCLLDVLRYDATYYVEELLAFLTRLILLFAPHAAFATRFVELHGDGMICDALNSEKSEAVMQNVANALYLLAEWKQLRLSAHATQVLAIAKILQGPGANATLVGAHLVMAMCTHPDIYERRTNLQQLTAGRVMLPLVEALRTASKQSPDPAKPKKKAKGGKGSREDQDPFEALMAAISTLVFGELSVANGVSGTHAATYHEGLMYDLIQGGGVDICLDVLIDVIRTLMEPHPEAVVLLQRTRAHVCIGLLATLAEQPLLQPEILSRDVPEAAIVLFAMADLGDDMGVRSASAALRLLDHVTRSSHECRLRVVLHENSISLFEGLRVFRPDFTIHQLRLFTNIVVDEFLDEPVPFSDDVGMEVSAAISNIVGLLLQGIEGLGPAELTEHLKLSFKLLQRICRKPGAATAALQALPLKLLQGALVDLRDPHVRFYLAHLVYVLRPYAAQAKLKEFRNGGLPHLATQMHLELVEMEKRRNLYVEPPPTYRNQLVLHECVLGIQRVWRAYSVRKSFLTWRHYRRVKRGLVHFRAWAFFLAHFYHRVVRFRLLRNLLAAETKARIALTGEFHSGMVDMIRRMDGDMMRYDASLKVQRLWRRYKAGLDVARRRAEAAEERQAGRVIARWWLEMLARRQRRRDRIFLLRKLDATLVVQHVGRGYLARRWLGFHFLQTVAYDAAATVQRRYRGWKARRAYATLRAAQALQVAGRHRAAFNVQRVWRGHCVRRDLRALLRGREQHAAQLVYEAEEHRRAALWARQEADRRERLALEAERRAREEQLLRAMEREAEEADRLRLQVKAEKARLVQLRQEAEEEERRMKALREAAEAEVEALKARREETEQEMNDWAAKRRRQERRAAERAAERLEMEKAAVLRLQEVARQRREEELQWEVEELERQTEAVRHSRAQLERDRQLAEERQRLVDEAERIRLAEQQLRRAQQEREAARRGRAAGDVQRLWRGCRGRAEAAARRAARAAMLARCATLIQATVRGMATRNRLWRLRGACGVLQRVWRGWLGRRAAEQVRRHHEWRRGAVRRLLWAWRRARRRPAALPAAPGGGLWPAVGPSATPPPRAAALPAPPPASPLHPPGPPTAAPATADAEPPLPAGLPRHWASPPASPQPLLPSNPAVPVTRAASAEATGNLGKAPGGPFQARTLPPATYPPAPLPFPWEAPGPLPPVPKPDGDLPPVIAPQHWAHRPRPRSGQRVLTECRRRSLERLIPPKLSAAELLARSLPPTVSPPRPPPSLGQSYPPGGRLPGLLDGYVSPTATATGADKVAWLLLQAQQQQYQQMMQVLQKQQQLTELQDKLQEDEQRLQRLREEKKLAREQRRQARVAESTATAPARPTSAAKRPPSGKARPARPSSSRPAPAPTLAGPALKDLVLREAYSRQEVGFEAERGWLGLTQAFALTPWPPARRPASPKAGFGRSAADAVLCAAP